MNLFSIFVRMLGMPKVNRATTARELSAIGRFRYQVYVNEFHRQHFSNITDATEQSMLDEHDELKSVVNYYIGTPDDIVATMRLKVWPAGAIPKETMETYQLKKFPDIQNTSIAEFDRYLVNPNVRGGKLLLAFLAEVMEEAYRNSDAELICAYAPLGLVLFYEKYGIRLFSDHIIEGNDGLVAAMVGSLYDFKYLKQKVNSLLYVAYKLLAKNKKPKHADDFFSDAFRQAKPKITIDDDAVAVAFSQVTTNRHINIFHHLPKEAKALFMKNSIILNVNAGTLIMREGLLEKELFVVVSGEMSVIRGGEEIASLQAGDIFGELALLGERNVHIASVAAKTDASVLVIRNRAMKGLVYQFPQYAIQGYDALAKIIIGRYETMLKKMCDEWL